MTQQQTQHWLRAVNDAMTNTGGQMIQHHAAWVQGKIIKQLILFCLYHSRLNKIYGLDFFVVDVFSV